MLITRMATRLAKPNGQHLAIPDDFADYMKDHKVSELPGKEDKVYDDFVALVKMPLLVIKNIINSLVVMILICTLIGRNKRGMDMSFGPFWEDLVD